LDFYRDNSGSLHPVTRSLRVWLVGVVLGVRSVGRHAASTRGRCAIGCVLGQAVHTNARASVTEQHWWCATSASWEGNRRSESHWPCV